MSQAANIRLRFSSCDALQTQVEARSFKFVQPKNDMTITLNGEKKEVPDAITVASLLEFLMIQRQRVAVELNQEIIKKDKFDSTALKEGDSLEVVSFMSGG